MKMYYCVVQHACVTVSPLLHADVYMCTEYFMDKVIIKRGYHGRLLRFFYDLSNFWDKMNYLLS